MCHSVSNNNCSSHNVQRNNPAQDISSPESTRTQANNPMNCGDSFTRACGHHKKKKHHHHKKHDCGSKAPSNPLQNIKSMFQGVIDRLKPMMPTAPANTTTTAPEVPRPAAPAVVG